MLISVESLSESRDLVCLAAPNDGFNLNVSNAAFIETDGYTNKVTKSCKGRDCGFVDNFKYCKAPKETFLLKSLGNDLDGWVVANRCDGGFKKLTKAFDREKTFYLYAEKMVFQIKNQIFQSSGIIESHPVLLLTEKDIGYRLKIQDFYEDLWLEELDREYLDISFWSIPPEDASLHTTACIAKEDYVSVSQLTDIHKEINYLTDEELENQKDFIEKTDQKKNTVKKTSPKMIRQGKLAYPKEAEQKSLSGFVVLNFSIDEYGYAQEISIAESSNRIFHESAIKALQNSKFKVVGDQSDKFSLRYDFDL